MKKQLILIPYLFISACATIPYPQPIRNYEGLSQVCQNEIQDLRAIDLSKPMPGDGFVKNQLCIAQKVCISHEKFDDAIWLDNVLADFIDAYLQKTQNWTTIIKKCEERKTLKPLDALYCQKDMAKYHIFTDLSQAVSKNGCGTDKDWKLLENAIRQCIDDAKYLPIINQYVKNRVISYRNKVRAQCFIELGKK